MPKTISVNLEFLLDITQDYIYLLVPEVEAGNKTIEYLQEITNFHNNIKNIKEKNNEN